MSILEPSFSCATTGRLAVVLCLLVAMVGCDSTAPDRTSRLERAYVYYCDGAGGGGVLANYAGGVKAGLIKAGYAGEGEVFSWNTGLGVIADQNSTVAYKRGKAATLAGKIQEYSKDYPNGTVTVMGLSAGTAIAVFTLEALPETAQVDNVVLLSSSVSANYDLTRALRRVGTDMYVFTSEQDTVLRYLVPISGTADRAAGRIPTAGLRGFQVPPRASGETREQYAKLVHIHWRPEFAKKGYRGGHTDVVNAMFVRDYVAPLVMKERRRVTPEVVSTEGLVRNPDHDYWSTSNTGAWTRFEGYEIIGGKKELLHVIERLVSKDDQQVVREMEYYQPGQAQPFRVQSFFEKSLIEPEKHPLTHPGTKVKNLPKEKLNIAGKTLECAVQQVHATANFPDWGRDIRAKCYLHNRVPGRLVQVELTSHKGEQEFQFFGKVVDYGIAPR